MQPTTIAFPPPARPGREFLTLQEVAQLCGVVGMTVRNWMTAKKIRYQKVGHVIRFYREDLKRFLLENTVLAAGDRKDDVAREIDSMIDRVISEAA